MDWRIHSCPDINSTSMSVTIDGELSPYLGMSGMFINRETLPDGGPSTDSIASSVTSQDYGNVVIEIDVGLDCQWQIHVEQAPISEDVPAKDCPGSITSALTSYGLGEVPISDLEALVPVKNHEFLYRMADDVRAMLEADPSLARDPSQLFGSGQAAAALCH